MDIELKKKIQKLCEGAPDEVVKHILESNFWLRDVNTGERYVRFDDDTRQGNISVVFSEDADAWVDVWSARDPQDRFASHRFRMPLFGGGQSPRVRTALLILALAIKLDNEKSPQNRPTRT